MITIHRLLRERGGDEVTDAFPRLLGHPATPFATAVERDARLFAP